ncbi:MAG: hypothetical protein WCJ95_22200 [Mariniphaga sp.]
MVSLASTFQKTGLIFSIFLFCTCNLLAQQTKSERGTAQIKVEVNMTEEQSKRKVEELARINAIENAFGTYVEQQANITVNSGKSDFRIIGQTKVKGEWINTLDGPEFKKDYKEGALWITCTIRGKIREATPKASLEYQTLSCPKMNCRSTTFTSGERLYLYFKSPLDGYLSIYLDDGNVVNRLLPYSSADNSNSVRISADKEYFFFTKGENNSDIGNAENVELITQKKQEYNTLYLIFSQVDYFKPVLNPKKSIENGYFIPKTISKNKFEDWLSNNRATLNDFIDRTVDIEILSAP